MARRGRRVSRVSRRNFSRSSDFLGKLRENIFTREITFVVLVLFGGMILFDIIGVDYTGLVVNAAQYNSISGGAAFTGVETAITNVLELPFAFLGPIANLFTSGNSPLLWRLILGAIFFMIVSPVLGRVKAVEGRNAKVIAVILAIAFAGLLPAALISTLFGDGGFVVGLIVTAIFGALGFYMIKFLWDKTSDVNKFGKVAGVMFTIILLVLFGFFEQVFKPFVNHDLLLTVFNLVYAFGIMGLVIILIRSLISTGTPTSEDMEGIKQRDSDKQNVREFTKERNERREEEVEGDKEKVRSSVMNVVKEEFKIQSNAGKKLVRVLKSGSRDPRTCLALVNELIESIKDENGELGAMSNYKMNEFGPSGRSARYSQDYKRLRKVNDEIKRVAGKAALGSVVGNAGRAKTIGEQLEALINQKKALVSRLS